MAWGCAARDQQKGFQDSRLCVHLPLGALLFSGYERMLTLTLTLVRVLALCASVGLTDYEVRDLNDEINKLIREKGHWENQIIALGGANYKRGVPKMLDDSGKEVPGTRGYK